MGFPKATYEARMEALKLERLDLRRDLLDLNFTHQCAGRQQFCPELEFAPSTARYPLSHSHRLKADRKPIAQRRWFFPNRVARNWNALPERWTKLRREAFSQKARSLLGLPVEFE